MNGVKFNKLSNLKRFGEIFLVTTKKNIQGKLSVRGTVCMLVGYSQSHSNNFYRLFYIITRQATVKGYNWLAKLISIKKME
jgi:hypothetical protein